MSQADVDMLRRGFDAFSNEGITAVFDFASDDFELVTPPGVGGERYRGREGTLRALQDQLDVFEDWTVEPREFVDRDRHVVVVVHQHVRGRGSGVVLDTDSAWDFEMNEGKVVRLTVHATKEEALAAIDQTRRQ